MTGQGKSTTSYVNKQGSVFQVSICLIDMTTVELPRGTLAGRVLSFTMNGHDFPLLHGVLAEGHRPSTSKLYLKLQVPTLSPKVSAQ